MSGECLVPFTYVYSLFRTLRNMLTVHNVQKTVQALMHMQSLAFISSFLLLQNYSTNLLKYSKPPE
jgi:hypothetical protein